MISVGVQRVVDQLSSGLGIETNKLKHIQILGIIIRVNNMYMHLTALQYTRSA